MRARALLFSRLLIASSSVPPAAHADPTGAWVGYWERDGSRLEVEAAFARGDSGYEGAFSSAQLRVVGIPFRQIRYDEPRLSWELVGDTSTTVFDGTVAGETLAGSFREGSAQGSFRLTRAPRVAAAFREEPITFDNGPVRLSGTVIYPTGPGPFPGVVFVHGSGAEGRWASRFLANAFARQGVASLIYDKRGVGTSTGDWRQVGFAELVADASIAAESLRARPRIAPDRVGIHGHSQGGTIAPWVASENRHVAFVVASAAGGMSMAETEIYSIANHLGLDAMPEADRQLADRYVRAMVATAYDGAPRADLDLAWQAVRDRPWAFPPPSESDSYWSFSRRIAAYDPLVYWRQVSAPALLIYGEDDARVPARASAAKIADAYLGSRGARLDVMFLSGADHTFRLPPDEPGRFQWPKTAPGYPDRMIEWVKKALEP
jgi:uncharacterized protein